MSKLLILVGLLLLFAAACDGGIEEPGFVPSPTAGIGEEMSKSDILRVLEKNENKLLSIKGVSGFGIQERESGLVIVVYVTDESIGENVPEELDGVSVEVEVSGKFDALPESGIDYEDPDVGDLGDPMSPTPGGE